MRMKDIAKEIDGYLKQFEADTKMNAPRGGNLGGTKPYYCAGAWQGGRYIHVRYVSYQGSTHMDRAQAEKYLAFLRQGGRGKHYLADV